MEKQSLTCLPPFTCRQNSPWVRQVACGSLCAALRGVDVGLPSVWVVTQVWAYARQAVLVGPSLCVPSVNTESRRRGSGGEAGTLRPPPARTCLRCPHPLLWPLFLPALAQPVGTWWERVCRRCSVPGARTRYFIRLFWCLASWESAHL